MNLNMKNKTFISVDDLFNILGNHLVININDWVPACYGTGF